MILDASPQIRRGVARWFVRETMGIVMAALILFLCAGRWDWVWGWATVITLAAWVGATALVVIPRNPALLAERVAPKKGSKSWDTAIVSVGGVAVLATYVLAGLDVRCGWTASFPAGLQVAAVVVTALGYAIGLWAVSANPFFSSIVRIQDERGHTVATGGPYRFVRHPGYVGTILSLSATPLMLGSWWAFVPGLISALLMVVRTSLEDRALLEELAGYIEYAVRVKHRLLPGVW